MRGFYCKTWSEDHPVPFADRNAGALRLAGTGGGAAGLFAVNRARWTYQHPCRHDFAVMGRPPVSPWPTVRFRRRSNLRRDAPSPAEVTLLEAVRYFDRSDPIPWSDAVAAVRDGNVGHSLGHLGMLRADAISWVADGENGMAPVFHDRISEVCEALASADSSRHGAL